MKKSKKLTLALAMAAVLNCGYAGQFVLAEDTAINQAKPDGNIAVEGNKSITADAVKKAVAGLESGQMKDAVLKLYNDAGYKLVRVGVAEDDDGKTTVTINETTLSAIHIEGNKYSSEAAVRSALPALKENAPINIKNLSGQVMLANDNAFRKMKVDLRPAGGDTVDAYVIVAETPSAKTVFTVDNTGNEYTGHYRTNLTYVDGNVGGKGQTVAVSFTTSPDHFSDVNQFGLFYNVPLPSSKDNIFFTASYSDVNSGRILDQGFYNIDASGKGNSFGLHYVKNLHRTPTAKEALSFGFDYSQYKNDTTLNFVDTPVPLGVDIDSMPFSLTYLKSKSSPNEKISYSLSYVHNIPGGGKNSDSQYELYRAGTKANYQLWRASANHQHMFQSGWLSNITVSGQYANERLIYPEQMGLGGMYSIRGLDERDVAGDKAIRASFEIYTPEISKGQRLLAFLDTGHFSNNDPMEGELTSGTATSIGLGWRYNGHGYSLSADWGYLLKGTDYTDKHSSKFHFLASKVF